MLASIYNNSSGNVELGAILFCSIWALGLGFVLAYTHREISGGSKKFFLVLTILPILVNVVMIIVNGSLERIITLIGIFLFFCFSHFPRSSEELFSFFLAMIVGFILGMGNVLFSAIVTLIISFFLVLFSKIKMEEKILKIVIPENLDYTNTFSEVFEVYTKKVELIAVKTMNRGSLFDLSYRVVLNKRKNENEFMDEIRIRNRNLKVSLSHPLKNIDM